MQRLGGSSLFPKLPVLKSTSTSTRLWECQTRHVHHKKWQRLRPEFPLRKTFPTFDISNILLDLDAEGVNGVRTFDDELDGVPEPDSAPEGRELQAVKERVADFEEKSQEIKSSFKSISSDKFNPLHISDFDILSLALSDATTAVKTAAASSSNNGSGFSSTNTIDSVLNKNGVPHTLRDDTCKTMTYMLRRQWQSRHLSSTHGDEALLEKALNTCSTFSELERLVTRTTQTTQGCRMLSKLNSEFHRCVSILGRDVQPIRMLSFLNNLIMNLENDGIYMGTDIYDYAIWTSLECRAIATAHQFIEKRIKNWGQLNDDFIKSILNKLLGNSIASSQFAVFETELNPSNRLTALFSLLTGYVLGEDQPRVSLRSLINTRKDPTVLVLYNNCLARLGAFRTIWHEWHTTDFDSESARYTAQKDTQGPSSFINLIGLVLASNSKMRNLAKSPGFASATGQYKDDCQLDMVAISRSAEILALPQEKPGLEPLSTFGKDSARLYNIFKEDQIQEAMSALQAFLIQKNSFS
ncbi:hypothetical protein HD806DRAFT_476615 [Xylariaceae sp. AK1471]|nr:hypothetical protein HD806DRAFT_476615 [Xylariaceae sp. AK1471]